MKSACDVERKWRRASEVARPLRTLAMSLMVLATLSVLAGCRPVKTADPKPASSTTPDAVADPNVTPPTTPPGPDTNWGDLKVTCPAPTSEPSSGMLLTATLTISGAINGDCTFIDTTSTAGASSCASFAATGSGAGTFRVPSIAYSGPQPPGGITYVIRVANFHGSGAYGKNELYPASDGRKPTIYVTRSDVPVAFSPSGSSTAEVTTNADGSGTFSFTGFTEMGGVNVAGKVHWTCRTIA